MKVFLYVLLLAAVTIPLGFLFKRLVGRVEAEQERDPERVRRVHARLARAEAAAEAKVVPHLPELERHPEVARFRGIAEHWGWRQITVEPQPPEHATRPGERPRLLYAGPLADVIARHVREPAGVHWRFEYDGTAWHPRTASLWLLGQVQGFAGTIDDDPGRLLQKFAHGVPAELWAEHAETFEGISAYEDPDRKVKLAECRRRAGSARPRPVD